jgi:hypothetical protein
MFHGKKENTMFNAKSTIFIGKSSRFMVKPPFFHGKKDIFS